jgi:hypothetical protein
MWKEVKHTTMLCLIRRARATCCLQLGRIRNKEAKEEAENTLVTRLFALVLHCSQLA